MWILIALDGICFLEASLRHVNIDSLGWNMFLGSLVGHIAIGSFVLMHKDMAFSSLESPPSPNVYDSTCESLCKPWLGIVNVL